MVNADVCHFRRHVIYYGDQHGITDILRSLLPSSVQFDPFTLYISLFTCSSSLWVCVLSSDSNG